MIATEENWGRSPNVVELGWHKSACLIHTSPWLQSPGLQNYQYIEGVGRFNICEQLPSTCKKQLSPRSKNHSEKKKSRKLSNLMAPWKFRDRGAVGWLRLWRCWPWNLTFWVWFPGESWVQRAVLQPPHRHNGTGTHIHRSILMWFKKKLVEKILEKENRTFSFLTQNRSV